MPELIPAEPGSPDWLAARRAGVTATDIVTILGLSTWDSVYSLFWRKMGQVPETEDNDRLRLGRELEDYVVGRWLEANSDALTYNGGLYQSETRPWQMATLDRRVTDRDPIPNLDAVLEVKTWADADRHSWGAECGGQGQPCDHVPPQVRAQVLWQMDVMDVAAGHVGMVFLPSGEFRSYVIQHDRDTGAMGHPKSFCSVCADLDLMRVAGEEFMARLRLELPPPDPDSSAATLAAVRARFTRQPDKTAEVDATTWNTWLNWKRAEDAAADLKREAEIKLRHEAGEAAVYTVEGQPVARRVITDAHVKAHVRHQDYLRRIKQGDDDE